MGILWRLIIAVSSARVDFNASSLLGISAMNIMYNNDFAEHLSLLKKLCGTWKCGNCLSQ